jgi:hypothetical protein
MADINLKLYSNSDEFNAFKKHHILPKGNVIKILFIGNSITWHAPSADLGWNLNCGMAAPREQLDYVHLLIKELNISKSEVAVLNCAEFERFPIVKSESFEKIKLINSDNIVTYTIIQLGDNVTSVEQLSIFFDNMDLLIKNIRSDKNRTFMVSTWWNSEVKNEVIRNLCKSHQISYIDISDLYSSPINPETTIIDYENLGVNNHPKSWGMEQIANRIYYAIKSIE